MTAEHPAEAPARITPGGNPVCPKCGRWYGPGEKHECEAPAQDVADVLAEYLSDFDTVMNVKAEARGIAAALAPLLAAARAEGRAEVEAKVAALADEIEGMPRTNFDFIRRERADLAARLRNLTPDPSALADRERVAAEKAWDEALIAVANERASFGMRARNPYRADRIAGGDDA